jgi:DNA processing protein
MESAQTPTVPVAAEHRSLLVVLNRRFDLSRDAICRLALRVADWAGAELDSDTASLAEEIGVTRRQLVLARRARRAVARVAREETRRAAAAGAEILTLADAAYPPPLLDLELPPPVLYVRGTLGAAPRLAIVGSRQADPDGIEAAELFARELAAAGLTIVSGLARGIDSAAHCGALEAPGGRTDAVLACGIDRVYPWRNARLAERISARGAVISEFPIGTEPMPRHFPIRNRLIAALAVGTLIVQAARRSGTLITARLALELGRDVYALPGPVFHQRAHGANELLRDGAFVALAPRDVLETLPLAIRDRLAPSPAASAAVPSFTGLPGRVVAALGEGDSLAPDELARRLGVPVADILSALLELEIQRAVRRYPGPVFRLRPRG